MLSALPGLRPGQVPESPASPPRKKRRADPGPSEPGSSKARPLVLGTDEGDDSDDDDSNQSKESEEDGSTASKVDDDDDEDDDEDDDSSPSRPPAPRTINLRAKPVLRPTTSVVMNASARARGGRPSTQPGGSTRASTVREGKRPVEAPRAKPEKGKAKAEAPAELIRPTKPVGNFVLLPVVWILRFSLLHRCTIPRFGTSKRRR